MHLNDLRLRIYRPIRLILDSYQVKKDKASGIVNDLNDWIDEVGTRVPSWTSWGAWYGTLWRLCRLLMG